MEWHTDFIRCYDGPEADELVSVKHKSVDRGVWSVSEMASEVLATLFKRWKALGARDRCTVVTNGGLKTGTGELRELADALPLGAPARLTPFEDRIAARISASVIETRAFLQALAIKTVGADESAIAAHVAETYCRPILLELGVSPSYSHHAYEAIFDLVYRIASGLEDKQPSTWTAWGTWSEQLLANRSIGYQRVCEALASIGITVDEAAAAARRIGAAPNTVMIKKLRRGGLGPSVQAGAPGLRAQWYALESQFREDIPIGSADEIRRLRRVVQNKAMLAESETRGATPYGPAMHLALNRELTDKSVRSTLPIDDLDLMGCAYQLTDECQVWWSERFDAYAEDADGE